MTNALWRGMANDQRDLGNLLRFRSLIPLSIGLWIAAGNLLTLPPGPLCDEGMVLFMEGGCDWGSSNIFFFAKATLLLVTNLALIWAWRRSLVNWRGFLPHLSLLGVLCVTFRSGEECHSYYAQPNGSLGQMTLELAAFAILGIVIGRATTQESWLLRGTALSLWNLGHVGVFYAWLGVTPHWTWLHTLLVAASLLVLALSIEIVSRFHQGGREVREEPLALADLASLGLMVSFFIFLAFPEEARLPILCLWSALAGYRLAHRYWNPAASWAGALVASSIPIVLILGPVVREYRSLTVEASSRLHSAHIITAQQARVVRGEAWRLRDADGSYPDSGFLELSTQTRSLAQNLIPPAADLPWHELPFKVLIPLDGIHDVVLWRQEGELMGEIRRRATLLRGRVVGSTSDHDFVEELATARVAHATTLGRYLLDRGLRGGRPTLRSGVVLWDGAGLPLALVVSTASQ